MSQSELSVILKCRTPTSGHNFNESHRMLFLSRMEVGLSLHVPSVLFLMKFLLNQELGGRLQPVASKATEGSSTRLFRQGLAKDQEYWTSVVTSLQLKLRIMTAIRTVNQDISNNVREYLKNRLYTVARHSCFHIKHQ